MAKAPRLGKLYGHPPKWWHQAEPTAVTPEAFRPAPDPSPDTENESRFKKLAEIVLQEAHRGKRSKQAA
jgi:hypothetical protein